MSLIKKKHKFNKKINIGVLLSLLFLAIPALSLSFVFIPSLNGDYKNYFTTYDNALDMSLALGIAPDFDTTSSSGKIDYANYLQNHVNNNLTKYKNVSIMDGQEVNRTAISALEPNTIVLNEWLKADEHKFNGIVNNIAYTSMGDSLEANYLDDEIKTLGSTTYKETVSVPNAFKMMARDLDRIYGNSSGNYFEKKAVSIINSQIERIKKINQMNNNFSQNKTLGIFYTKATKSQNILASNLSIYAPSVYPFLYSKKPDRGIGFDFPSPVDPGFENLTHYKTYDIKAESSRELIRQFKNKFDYLIIIKSDTSDLEFVDILNTSDGKELLSVLKNPDKDQTINNKRIQFGLAGDWYTNAWGIIGIWDLLNKFSTWFSLKEDLTNIWKPNAPETLRLIRLGEAWN